MNTLLLDRSINVLLISNFPDDSETIRTLLNSFPYTHPVVLHAQDTLEKGVNLLKVYDVDIVILATNLTEKDPKEAIKAIQQAHKDIPVVMLSSASLLDMGFFYYHGAQQTLSRSGLTAPHLAQALAWTLEKKELQQQLLELQEKQKLYFWELDIENNSWKGNDALEKFLGTKLSSLNQFLPLVSQDSQAKVAMAFMQGIRQKEAFELTHTLNTPDQSYEVKLSGKPQVSPTGTVVGIQGQIQVLGPAQEKKEAPSQVKEVTPPVKQAPPTPPTPVPPVHQEKVAVVPQATPATNGQNGSSQQKYTNINYLKQVSGGDTVIMRKAISKFLETTPEMINQLDTQLKTQDFDQLAKTAHKLKSSVGLMGMEELQQTMQNIEFVAKSKERLDVLPVLVNRTRKMLIHSLSELNYELQAL